MKPNKYLLTLTGFFMLTIVVGADFKQKSYDPFFRKGREENRLFSIWTPVEPFVEFKMFGGEVAYGQEEAPTVDYEKLGKKASKINANKNPDEVIELLAPYKDDRNNKSLTFYNNLGLAYIKQRRNNEAIALFKHALGSNPNEPTMHYNLAIAYYNNNQLDKALKHISMSLELRPSDEDTKKWREHISSKLKREITYYAEEKPKVTGESLEQLESQLQEEIPKRKQAEEELRALGGSLEKLAAERTTELAKTTAQLQEEISKRKQAEEELKALGGSLEKLAAERTTELAKTTAQLQEEISKRKQAEEELKVLSEQAESELKALSESLKKPETDRTVALARTDAELQREISKRKQAEEELKALGGSLEKLAAERTTELAKTTAQLQEEISKRKQAEEELKALGGSLEKLAAEHTAELAKTTAQLQEEISKRKQAEEELKTLGESLEQLVSERVNEITIANTELHTTIVEHKWATEHIELALEKAKQLFDAKKYQEVVFILEPQYKIIAEESSETSSETDIEIFDAVKTVLSAAYVELSDSYFYANNNIMAEYAAREAVNVNPNNSWGYNNLGFLCSHKDEYQKAEET